MFKLFKKKHKEVVEAPTKQSIIEVIKTWKETAPEYITSYETGTWEDFIYVKIFYTKMTSEQKNDLYVEISNLSCLETFRGVREYIDNNEMCFVFKK